jgi:hypothetical protein
MTSIAPLNARFTIGDACGSCANADVQATRMAPQTPTSGIAAMITTEPSEMVSMSRLPREESDSLIR